MFWIHYSWVSVSCYILFWLWLAELQVWCLLKHIHDLQVYPSSIYPIWCQDTHYSCPEDWTTKEMHLPFGIGQAKMSSGHALSFEWSSREKLNFLEYLLFGIAFEGLELLLYIVPLFLILIENHFSFLSKTNRKTMWLLIEITDLRVFPHS